MQLLKNNKLNKQTNKTSCDTLTKRTKSTFFSWCLQHSRTCLASPGPVARPPRSHTSNGGASGCLLRMEHPPYPVLLQSLTVVSPRLGSFSPNPTQAQCSTPVITTMLVLADFSVTAPETEAPLISEKPREAVLRRQWSDGPRTD